MVTNWCLRQDGVVAIPKGGSQEHILENRTGLAPERGANRLT